MGRAGTTQPVSMETGGMETDDGGDVELSPTELSGSHRIPLHLSGRENGVQFPNCKSQSQRLAVGRLVSDAGSFRSQGYVTRSPVAAF